MAKGGFSTNIPQMPGCTQYTGPWAGPEGKITCEGFCLKELTLYLERPYGYVTPAGRGEKNAHK